MNTKRLVIWVVAFLVIALLVVTCATGNAEAAPVRATTQGETFSAQAERVYLKNRCNCWVWRWADSWAVVNAFGRVQYRFGLDVEWKATARKTRVKGLVFNFCMDQGGYFDFDGCRHRHGKMGYSSLGMFTVWHYHFGVPSIGARQADPSVRFDLHANGAVDGTVYYDN